MGNKRFIVGYLVGLILGLFGVFIYSDFEYAGIALADIFQDMTIPSGLYQFFWLSFRFNFFNIFDPSTITSINILETLYPALLGWFSAGLVSGTIVKGAKRGAFVGLIIVLTDVIIWVCFALISGANVTYLFATNIYETGGGIVTGLVGAILGGIIGAAISGRYSD